MCAPDVLPHELQNHLLLSTQRTTQPGSEIPQ